jgi:hypothetical protein
VQTEGLPPEKEGKLMTTHPGKDRCFGCTPRCNACDQVMPHGMVTVVDVDMLICQPCQNRLTVTQARSIGAVYEDDLPLCEDCCANGDWCPICDATDEAALAQIDAHNDRLVAAQDMAWDLAPETVCPNGHTETCSGCAHELADKILAEPPS